MLIVDFISIIKGIIGTHGSIVKAKWCRLWNLQPIEKSLFHPLLTWKRQATHVKQPSPPKISEKTTISETFRDKYEYEYEYECRLHIEQIHICPIFCGDVKMSEKDN